MAKRKLCSFFGLFVTFCILLQSSPGAYAQSPASSQYEILCSIGGPTNAVAVGGSYVYVGKGTSVIVLEYLDKRLIQKGQQLTLPAIITDLKVSGKTLYAAAGSKGLYIIDIRNPLEPTETGVYKSAGYAESVAVAGTTAYLANGAEGLQIIDVSNPAKPMSIGQTYKGKYAFGVAVSGNTAYIAAANDGLLIADISQPNKPKELASFDTPGVSRNVAVSDGLAFVADDWKGVCVINISDPAKPVVVQTINTAGRAHGLALDNNYLYVADAYMGLRVFDISDMAAPKDLTSFIPAGSQMIRVVVYYSTVYCADQTNGILCFDTSNPAELKLTGFYSHTIPIPLQLPSDIMNYDYKESIARLLVLGIVSDGPDGIRRGDTLSRAELAAILCNVMQVQMTENDSEQRFSDVPKTDWAVGYIEKLAAILCNVTRVRISENSIEKLAAILCNVMRVQMAENNSEQRFSDVPKTHWAFGCIEKATQLGLMEGKGGGLFDPEGTVTNAEAVAAVLSLVGRAPATGTWPSNVMDECDKLGLAIYVEGNADDDMRRGRFFALLDKTVMEIPDAKTQRTLLQSKFGVVLQGFPMNCVQITVKDGYAYVTCGEGGLSVVDVSNPENLRQVAHIDFPELVGHIRIYKNYAYLPAIQHLYVQDISDPLHPYCIDALAMAPSTGPPRGVDIESDTMYIADEWGFKIISLSDPAKPVLIMHQNLMGEPSFEDHNQSSDIAVRDGIAYISMAHAGTMLFDVTDSKAPEYLSVYKGGGFFATNILFIGNLGFCVSLNMIDVLDISDIKNPKSIDRLDPLGASQSYQEIGTYKNLLFFPNGTGGVAVFDASTHSNIKPAGAIDTIGTTSNIFVEGDFAYIAGGIGGMSVVALDNTSSVPSGGSSSATPVSSSASVFNSEIFAAYPAEKYVLTADKALAALNSVRTEFSETLTVSNTNDNGQGSLRWCLENIKEGGRIQFDTDVFRQTEPGVIYLESTLEWTTGNVTLDAGSAGVIIDISAGENVGRGLSVDSDGNVIRGLTLRNFTEAAIFIGGGNNIIGGNRLNGAGPNGEGNVILNGGGGIWISGSDNIVVGNNIGVGSDGVTPAVGSGGLHLRGSNATRNIIGIDVPGYGNIVSNNTERGITMMEGTYCNLIEGNLVGTDITGTKPMGNYDSGITIELCGFGNIIRNNVSCANARHGLLIGDDGGSFNIVVGNSSGVGADGKTLMPNNYGPVFINGGGGACFYNVFGDSEPSMQNFTYDVHGNIIPIIPEVGFYETIINGKVYKCADKNAY